MNGPICACDADPVVLPTNPPGLDHIAWRAGTWREFRRAVLTPLPGETALSVDGVSVWRTQGQGDLAVMMAEWFAYLADILTFYNERIANQAYLRTADLDESVTRLIAVLGYRPRPAIGAFGTLAALVSPGQSAVLPKGLQFQSKPGPGQPPQIFELGADTPIAPPDQVAAAPPPRLLNQQFGRVLRYVGGAHVRFGLLDPWRIDPIGEAWPTANYSLLAGVALKSTDPGAWLRLRPRDSSLGPPLLATVSAATVQPGPSGGQQTNLDLAISGTPPAALTAAQAVLERPNQNVGLWSFFTPKAEGTNLHLASLVRQIRPGDQVILSGSAGARMASISAVFDKVWDATGTSDQPTTPADANHPMPIPHTVLTLAAAPGGGVDTVHFDWIGVGPLVDQPYGVWQGSPTALVAAGATPFPATTAAPVLVQDLAGSGFATKASSAGDGQVQLGAVPDPAPALTPPFQVLYNTLAVTRGKTVANEVLGGGDATRPGQDFALAQSPVTYLQHGAVWSSTVSVRVDGQPWTEVPFFYGQAPDAEVFVTREDEAGKTHVMFGDGINGARLPTGTNNVVATYRVGAGTASPPAGKLTVIAQAFPGLRAVLNPVAAAGGADPDPPHQIRRYAPRSVLTFGRAVSVFDYEALAAGAPSVARARAVWAWNDARQRTLVTVYVGDDEGARASAEAVLQGAGDPNRPVSVVLATARPVSLSLTLLVTPGMDAGAIVAAVTAALTDPVVGLFAAANLPIGRPLFDSQIEAAVLAVRGAVAITAQAFVVGGAADPGPLHDPGEGGYFTLDPADLAITPEGDPHG